MKLTLQGTGGADGIPGLFGDSRVSEYARQHGGRDVRTRAAALVNEDLKIDFGPDTFAQVNATGSCPRDWSAVVFTHSDADHFAIEELQYAVVPFTAEDQCPFTIYANGTIIRRLRERYPDWPMDMVTTQSFTSFSHADYVVTPIKANHGSPTEDTQNLLIEQNGRTLLYATDTGIWDERTWRYLQGITVNLLVIECSEGFVHTPYNGHLDAHECLAVVSRLRQMGTLTTSSQVVTTHHSHNGDATHEELAKWFEPHRILVGYDGLVLEV